MTQSQINRLRTFRRKDDATIAPLVDGLRVILSSTFYLYYKAHAIHWNVEGEYFPQFHAYFGEVYETIHDAVDAVAEQIRALGSKAPATIMLLTNQQPIDTMTDDDDCTVMITSFCNDNERIIGLLKSLIPVAGQVGEPGAQNFLQDRLMYHQKLQWQITATLK